MNTQEPSLSIRLTASAAARARHYLSHHVHGVGLRLAVKKTGCSGLMYVVELADEVTAEDEVIEDRDVQIVVSRVHLPLFHGTEVDFVRDGLNENFVFRNPNVKGECGCGESFTV
jgi:iron-sulfur cluster assembly protein